MSTRLVSPSRRGVRTRVGAVAAVVILPLALAGCGSDDDNNNNGGGGSTTGGGTTTSGPAAEPIADIRKGFDGILDSKSASFELALEDKDGNLKKAIQTDADAAPLADTILGGTVRFTVDPAGDTTLRDISSFGANKPFAEQIKAGNFDFAVSADGGELGQIRLVDGVVYANVALDKIDGIAKKAGETGFTSGLNSAAGAGSPFGPLLTDVKAGKWIKLDLNQFSTEIDGLLKSVPTPTASAAVDGSKLVDDLVQAILPATSATKDGDTYNLEIKGKEAITSAAAVLQKSGFPGLNEIDTADFNEIPADGVLKATATLDGDKIKEISVDIDSFNSLLPAADRSKTSLAGGFVTLTVNDGAEEVKVPDNISSVDVGALVKQFLGSLGGAFGGGNAPAPARTSAVPS